MNLQRDVKGTETGAGMNGRRQKMLVNIKNSIKAFIRNEKGVNLLEMLIAVAILAAIGVTFISAYNTNTVSVGILEQKTRAMHLAMDHVDYLRNADFATDYTAVLAGIQLPPQYESDILLEYSSNGENWTEVYSDQTLQRIIVSISQGGESLYSICTFKWQ